MQHHAELLRFLRECLVGQRELFKLFLDFAESVGLRGFRVVQPFLVGFQLLFERFDKAFDVAFGAFLEFPERLFGQPQEFRRVLFKGVGAQCFESFAQIGQRLVLQHALFHNHFFRRGATGFGGSTGIAGLGELAAQLGQFRFALGDLLAQFPFQSRIRPLGLPRP